MRDIVTDVFVLRSLIGNPPTLLAVGVLELMLILSPSSGHKAYGTGQVWFFGYKGRVTDWEPFFYTKAG